MNAHEQRGYDDYFSGHHMNPYAWDIDAEQFHDWARGYIAARELAELFA